MRKTFERQYALGQVKIEDIQVNPKSRDAFPKLVLALKELFSNKEYNAKLFSILEDKLLKNKKPTGRPGMDLWNIFVLAQTRMSLNINIDRLHHMANHDNMLRQLMGIDTQFGVERVEVEYQSIWDNVRLLDNVDLQAINSEIVLMGHKVFKKKETEPLRLKTDSFVVKSNVHFPTDYNLLWDSARKVLSSIEKLLKTLTVRGWRKLRNWARELKNLYRSFAQSAKKSEDTRKKIAAQYLEKAKLLEAKTLKTLAELSPIDAAAHKLTISKLKYYIEMLTKHIDLTERRVIKGETIEHAEKVFSIFETYTRWINKGKLHPPVELGVPLAITTDQFHLITDFELLTDKSDSQSVIGISERVLPKFSVGLWSFDKGFFSKENKDKLAASISELVMPKKGKLNKTENEHEHRKEFIAGRHAHSAVESNINELEHRGLDRCPDRGETHFRTYVGLGVCAYNLHRIGAELQRQALQRLRSAKAA
jgi:hemerythrin-like domain-containing protein